MSKLSRRYFFESDLLFRLNTIRAAVTDVPMTALYGREKSGLNAFQVIPEFLAKNLGNAVKRIFYNYFLRGFSVASLQLFFGSIFLAFGSLFGAVQWRRHVLSGVFASTGTVMVAALPVLVGFQLLLSFLDHDIQSVPRRPIHLRLAPHPSVGPLRKSR
jgi:hypothetical protein